MQGVIIFYMCELALVLSLSAIFCSVFAVVALHRRKDEDDTEDDLGYLQYLG